MRNNISIGVAIALIIAGVSAYILMRPAPAKAPGITLPADGYSEHAQYYDITADAAFIAGGTTPEEKNFANFFFDNKDFGILFAPYAVAPYSSGPQTLRIPLSELSSLLKPEYR